MPRKHGEGECKTCDMIEVMERRPTTLAPIADRPPSVDMVNAPPHYKGARFRASPTLSYVKTESGVEFTAEPVDVAEAFELNHFRATVFYYIVRAGKKGDEVEDLKKAAWFLAREIARLERLRE